VNRSSILPLAAALATALVLAPAARAGDAPPDTMVFRPADGSTDTTAAESGKRFSVEIGVNEDTWLRAPVGDALLTAPEPWRERHHGGAADGGVLLDYNRVDELRYGMRYEAQSPETMYPRLGTQVEYSTGRSRWLYGVQIEQPLLPTARFVLGLGMTRRTDHPDLQQVDDLENSLALLVAHEDWRDYFEREGFGSYLSWRVPDFSTVSVHLRSDQYRSLESRPHLSSWFHRDRTLRANPAIDEGESHRALLRLERMAHRTNRMRGGLYHWIELQKAGGQLGGDFDYTRAIADVRSVLRVSPAVTMSLRAVGGSTIAGELPRQEQFSLGGVDGLRAHPIGTFRGDQMALAQAEYTIGLWQLHSKGFEGGLHAIVFADAGTAWNHPDNGWDVTAQKFAVDGGFGLATSEDDVRLTFARNLQEPDSDFVVGLRLQRPF
jgi:hypothetical protein